MNDLDLETRLRAAAPEVSSPLGLADHAARIMQEGRTRRTRRLRIWAAGVTASAVILGGGAVAVAGNGLQTPWGWTADNVYQIPGPNGQTCFAGLLVEPDGVADNADVVIAAREFVAGLDLETIDTSEATAEWEARNDQPFADGSPGIAHYTQEEIAQSAIVQTVADLLFEHLQNQGLTTSKEEGSVSLMSQNQGCL